jgi:hypothetical protein
LFAKIFSEQRWLDAAKAQVGPLAVVKAFDIFLLRP